MEPFSYPPEYRHVEQLVRETNERIQQIDQEIENLPPDREGWAPPAPRPPGTPPPPTPPTRQQIIDARRGLQQSERERAFKEVETATANAEPKLKRQMLDTSRENLFGNEYKGMDGVAFETARHQKKGFEQSANYMDAHLGKKSNPDPSGPRPSGPTRPDPDDPRPDGPNRPNASQQQNQPPREQQTPAALAAFSLNFSTMAQKEEAAKAKAPEKQEPQTERSLSPSEQAEQTLRARYEPSKTEDLSDKTPAPEKDDGPDIDR